MTDPKTRNRIELVALIIVGLIVFIGLSRFEIFEWFVAFSRRHEAYDLDEFFMLFVVAGVVLPIALIRKNRHMRRNYIEHQRTEQTLRGLAEKDSLTRLGNRVRFKGALLEHIQLAQDVGLSASLIKIDLDGFKQINDLRGLPAGDVLLTRVADRVVSICGENDTVLRVGGDEFAILTSSAPDDALDLAKRILARMRDPFEFETWRAELTVSIGVGVWEPGMSAADLLSRGDQAMFWAKESGRNTLVEYDQSIGDLTRRSAQMRDDLMRAVELDQIKPYFQPIVCLSSGQLIGFEALARWRHVEHGFVSPEVFIALAEDFGLINKLTDNLFRHCCDAMIDWPDHVRLSFNLSPVQLTDQNGPRDGQLVGRLCAQMKQSGVDPSRIDFEITERAVIADIDAACRITERICALGAHLSLDDFGTGTSSLEVLSKLPFHTIKIDRSFITDITNKPELQKIVTAVLYLADSMNMTVTAEGIETPVELQFLRDHGCDKGQGYLLGRPTPVDQLDPILAWDGAVWNVGQIDKMRAVRR